jgi:hypothetical protein
MQRQSFASLQRAGFEVERLRWFMAFIGPGRSLFPETGRFAKKNREAIKHEPRNHWEELGT